MSIGYLGTQYTLKRYLAPHTRDMDQLYYLSALIYNTWAMLILQSLHIRSAYIFAVMSSILLVGLFTNTLYTRPSLAAPPLGLPETYGPALFFCMIVGVEAFTTILDIFTPLTGRIGKDAPAEYIIATLTSSMAFTFYPIIGPLFHRLSRLHQRRVLMALGVGTLLVMGLFAGRWWKTYDAMHPKRTATQYLYNVSCSTGLLYRPSLPLELRASEPGVHALTHHSIRAASIPATSGSWTEAQP